MRSEAAGVGFRNAQPNLGLTKNGSQVPGRQSHSGAPLSTMEFCSHFCGQEESLA